MSNSAQTRCPNSIISSPRIAPGFDRKLERPINRGAPVRNQLRGVGALKNALKGKQTTDPFLSCAFASTRAPWTHACRRAVVAKIVEEYFSRSRFFCHRSRVAIGRVLFHCNSQRFGETLGIIPARAAFYGNDDMKTFAAGRLHKRYKAEGIQAPAQFLRAFYDA